VKRRLVSLLGFAIAGVFVWLLARQVDLHDIATAAGRLGVLTVLAAVGSLAIGYSFRVCRWWWLLRALDPGVRFGTCWRPFLTSIAVNNLLPFRAGDALRVVGFRHELRAPAMRVLGTMVVERLLDLLTLLCLFFLTLPRDTSALPRWLVQWTTVAAILASASLCTFLFLAPRIKQAVISIVEWSMIRDRPWALTVRDHVTALLDAVAILRSAKLTLQVIALSFLAWIFEGGVFLVVAARLDAVPGLLAPWFSLAMGTLATLIPSSPGYVGTFDYFSATGLVVYGVGREQASAFAILVHLLLWVPLTLAGGVYLLVGRSAAAPAAMPDLQEPASFR
jgi:uncharacterized protein (TIRG00374 family)